VKREGEKKKKGAASSLVLPKKRNLSAPCPIKKRKKEELDISFFSRI